MTYDFPERLTGSTGEDVRALWETLWKLVERLNLNDEALTKTLAQLSNRTTKESTESAVYNGEVL